MTNPTPPPRSSSYALGWQPKAMTVNGERVPDSHVITAHAGELRELIWRCVMIGVEVGWANPPARSRAAAQASALAARVEEAASRVARLEALGDKMARTRSEQLP